MPPGPVEGYPYIQYPLGAGYLNAGMPPAASPPAAAQAESPVYSDGEVEVEEEKEDELDAMEPEISALELDLAVEGNSLSLSLANLNGVLAHHGLEATTIPAHEMIPRNTRFLLEQNGLPQDHKPIFAADWERYTLTETDMPHVPRGIVNPDDGTAGLYADDPSNIDSWTALRAECAKTAPEEYAFDFKAFSDNMANLAEHIADLGMYGTFGSFANGTVRLYFGYPPLAAVDDMTAHEIERAHVLQDNWVGRNDLTLLQLTDVIVHETSIAVELKEARRTAGLVTKYTTAVHRKIKKRKRAHVTIRSDDPMTRAEKYAILAEIYSELEQDAEHGATEHLGSSEWANGVLNLRGREYDSDVDQPNRASDYDPYEHHAYEIHRGRADHRGEDDTGGPSGYDPYCSASIFLNDRFYDSDDTGGTSG